MPKAQQDFAALLAEKNDHYGSMRGMQDYFRSVLEHTDFNLEALFLAFDDGRSIYHFCSTVNDMSTEEREKKFTNEEFLRLGAFAYQRVMGYNYDLADAVDKRVAELSAKAA